MSAPPDSSDSLPVLALAGTRPEAIKLAPVLRALHALGVRARLGVTGQHRGLMEQALADCGLQPEFDLEVMRHGQGLGALLGRTISALEAPLRRLAPQIVIVQGDTTSALAGALAAAAAQIPVAHVEAGLRSGDPRLPFPEETNRRLIADLARWHFAPSERARAALLAEGIASEAIHVTGNTVLDACLSLAGPPPEGLPGEFALVTLHRREILSGTGAPLRAILGALADAAEAHPELGFVFPAHPRVRGAAEELLGGRENLRLLPPQPYPAFLGLLRAARFALSDSGGVQEEGPALGTPVLVVRDKTERPEALESGGARLVGTDPLRIRAAIEEVLAAPRARTPRFPYGAGGASAHIARLLQAALRAQPQGAEGP